MGPQESGGSERGLRLLSIDGGGIRGLSPLLMLKEILYRIQQEKQLIELPRPCDVFDLAGGTSTGGLIVIMLFRLQMSIEKAISSYVYLAQHVFSEPKRFSKDTKFKASRLEEAIVNIVKEALKISEEDARSIRMLNDQGPKCFVCAMPEGNLKFPSLFRTWTPTANRTYNCTIVEATRATTAAPTFFKSIEFGEPIKQSYIGGDLGYNNPAKCVIGEAKSHFPNRPISCVVSLGTGAADVVGMERPDVFQTLLPTNLIAVLKGIATDCERISEEIARDFDQSLLYCRLNVDQGLQGVSLAEWEKLKDVQQHTWNYLEKYEIGRKVDKLVGMLKTSATTMGPAVLPTVELSATECEAFDKLYKSIASNAVHNSWARSTSSPCLPGTRLGQIERITKWIETRGSKKPLLLVLGTAGSGKTSLLNTVAQICKEKGLYAGGFFFSRTGTDRTRNNNESLNEASDRRTNESRLINTITYQIAENIPEIRPFVSRTVLAEPSILDQCLESQPQRLLLGPLRQLRSQYPDFSVDPRIVLIDALDECGKLEDQRHVISALAQLLSDDSFPFPCVLSTRFDRHLEHELSKVLESHIHDRVILGADINSEGADIKKYLHDSILHIRDQHTFGSRIPAEGAVDSDLETFVERSGGQFIYAATVIKYIDSPDHNPRERLQSMLAISTTADRGPGADPFAALDDLYQSLMSSVQNTDAVLEILGIHLVQSTAQFWIPDVLNYLHADFFTNHFQTLDADVALAPLASVLKCEDGFIEIFHLTFTEFLLDSTRSGKYFVQPRRWQKWIVSRLVPFFYDRGSILPKDVEHLVKAAISRTEPELFEAVNDGLKLVADHPITHANLLPSGSTFNLWPFAVFAFFLQLNYWTPIENMAVVFSQKGEGFLPLPILITCASTHKFSNSFLLIELCRTCVLLQQTGCTREESWITSPNLLLLFTTYLAEYLQDQHSSGQSVLLPEDYQMATLRCLWYLQSFSWEVHIILQEEFHLSSVSSWLPKPLPAIFGIPNFLDDFSSNLTRGAIEVLPTLLPHAHPSIDLLTALKQPFDSEVILRNLSSWHKAKVSIHNYLTQHDPEYSPSEDILLSLDNDADVGEEDEPMPDFEVFLHPRRA